MEIVVYQTGSDAGCGGGPETGVLLGKEWWYPQSPIYMHGSGHPLGKAVRRRVTVISMGPPRRKQSWEAYMMGRTAVSSDGPGFAGTNTLATALAAAGIEKDRDVRHNHLRPANHRWDTAQVGQVCGILGLPHESNVLSVGALVEGRLHLVRDGGATVDTVAVGLPVMQCPRPLANLACYPTGGSWPWLRRRSSTGRPRIWVKMWGCSA